MKILFITGSSKNGNTTEIIKYFKSKLKGDYQIEDLYLSDYPVDFCIGCHNCIMLGEEKCPHYDSVKKIEEKILESDITVLSSPGYMFSITGIMKNFLDHVAYNCHRPKYFGKKIFYIGNCTKWQNETLITPMSTWGSAAGFKSAGKLFVDMFPFPLTDKELNNRRKTIEKSVVKFEKNIMNNEIKPDFGSLMVFRAFRTISQLVPGIMKADNLYMEKIGAYNPEKKWFINVKISLFKRIMADTIEKSMKKSIGSMIDKERLSSAKSGIFRNKLM